MFANDESTNKTNQATIEHRADHLSSSEATATSVSKPLSLISESGSSDLLQTFLQMDEKDPEVEELAAASSINRRLLNINAIPAEKLAPDSPSRPPVPATSFSTAQESSDPFKLSPSSLKIFSAGRSTIPPSSPTMMPLEDDDEQDFDLVEVDEAGIPVDYKARERLYIPTLE